MKKLDEIVSFNVVGHTPPMKNRCGNCQVSLGSAPVTIEVLIEGVSNWLLAKELARCPKCESSFYPLASFPNEVAAREACDTVSDEIKRTNSLANIHLMPAATYMAGAEHE